jgi:hypothetical protein
MADQEQAPLLFQDLAPIQLNATEPGKSDNPIDDSPSSVPADVNFETPKRSKIFPPGQDNSSGTPLQRIFLLGDVLGSVKLHDFFTNKKRDIPKAEAKFLLNRFTISPLEIITF